MIGPDLLWSKDRDTGGAAIEALWDGQGATRLMADLEASGARKMRVASYPDGVRQIIDRFFPGKRDEAIAAIYAPWVPVISYENRRCGLAAAKALMREGDVIGSDMGRRPPHPATRAGVIENAGRLDPMALRWSR
jgi:4-hydroxy-tetrahydrodipicolinate synthase